MKRLALLLVFTTASLLSASDKMLDAIEQSNQRVVALVVHKNNKKVHGTGLIFTSQGLVITNYHVIASGQTLSGTLSNGKQVTLSLVQTSKKRDLAVLQINEKLELPKDEIKFAAKLRLGEEVFAIGNPLGLGHTVTVGRISGLQREIPGLDETKLKNIVQHSADLNPGNSGGPLFNAVGELVGLNVAMHEGGRGISFAVCADDVHYVMSKSKENKAVALASH